MTDVQTLHMQPLLGRVIVVAGDDGQLVEVAALAVTAGAHVAVISRTLDGATTASVRFNADPRDPDAWERIAMHIEQHLGPVDGVVADERSRTVVDHVFGADLVRRGRGAVLVVSAGDDPRALVTRLGDKPPAAPSRPRPDVTDR